MIDGDRILVVDDDIDMTAVLKSSLEYDGFRVEVATSLDEMKTKIKQCSYDAILLDLFLGDENGAEALPFLVREAPFTVVIVMTVFGSLELAVKAVQRGAATFVAKADDPKKITSELKIRLLHRKPTTATSNNDEAFRQVGLLGNSPAYRHVLDQVVRIKDTDATVLIYGESGTGKELIARAIHKFSQRSDQHFETLNCAAIPETLLESELFGHKRGIFADAEIDRKGLFEVCSDGTLLLDEIGEMTLALQAKLLRALQQREVTPLGASLSIRVNTRIMAATNCDLEEEVLAGRFREDLFHRLNVISVYLPPLRDRREDIPFLVDVFLENFNTRYGKKVGAANKDVLLRMEAYDWPGNVRELQNAVERAVILSNDDELHIEDILQKKMPKKNSGVLLQTERAMTLSYAEAKEAFERAFVMRILTASKGCIAEAARLSGRYRSDIYRLAERYKINPDEFKSQGHL